MHAIKTLIYQTTQIRELEQLARERFGIAETVMMQRAGKAACDFMLRRWPQAQKIAVFCGGGNNGGDGYRLAQSAKERGLQVQIWQVGQHDKLSVAAQEAQAACQQANILMQPWHERAPLEHSDIIVDAICGMGVHTALREDIVAVIHKIHHASTPIFALDVPTGIDANTGKILGEAINATATMTFIGFKLGLLTGNGIAHTGELVLSDLQFPAELFSYVEPVAEKIQSSIAVNYLKPRARDWHKGLSGHVLVIGGEQGFSGAPRMAAEAALRVGAGLASVATHIENAATMNATCPEVMCHGVSDVNALKPLLAKADVIVMGPGLGQSVWAKSLYTCVRALNVPLVVDADGLNILAEQPSYNENWILTPHPGEAARLLQQTTTTIQADRFAALKAIHQRYGGVCILKGAGSLVLSANSLPALCDKGNPGMATAGMGDVLSGVIAGLLAQGIPLGEAAKLGVYLHALAGDLAAKEGERGMIATDLMPYLRRLVNL